MAYTNTREAIGDKATLDGLVSRTLASLTEDGVSSVAANALYNNTGLESVNFPSATSIGSAAMQGCTKLAVADIGENVSAATIQGSAFNGCSNLNALILRASGKCTLSNTSALTGTKIASKNGAVYVPDNLVNTYKSDGAWGLYMIYPISSYPVSDFSGYDGSTITDTWEQILAAVNDGSYKDKYSVGGFKQISLGAQGTQYAQIAAIDGDELADGSGTAPLSFVMRGLLTTSRRMNATNTNENGWAACEMRTDYLPNTIKPLIPEAIRNRIVTVNKTYYDYTTKSTLTAQDDLWLPSAREIFGGTNYESSGVTYTGLFNSAAARIKYNSSGSAGSWWLRSAISGVATLFRFVSGSGSAGSYDANYAFGVALGFAIK